MGNAQNMLAKLTKEMIKYAEIVVIATKLITNTDEAP
jgi:hypothetical protein